MRREGKWGKDERAGVEFPAWLVTWAGVCLTCSTRYPTKQICSIVKWKLLKRPLQNSFWNFISALPTSLADYPEWLWQKFLISSPTLLQLLFVKLKIVILTSFLGGGLNAPTFRQCCPLQGTRLKQLSFAGFHKYFKNIQKCLKIS